MKPTSSFVGITSEGGLLPTDFLSELLAPKSAIEGLTPQSYSLAEGERVSEQVNRSWVRLKGRWADFKKAIGGKQPGDPTTTETRDRWLHPIFQELGFGQRLAVAPPIEVDGRSYPVSHGWTHVPIHLVGSHVDLDRRTPGAVGAAKASPHSLVQQALNASQRHLWGIVTNGLTFRLLRDSVALTRLSYVEWDLAGIFDGDLYSEFFLLWLVCHQSRFEGERAEQCWLERWKKSAEDKGLRALQELRPGVARAIEALGAGLVSHPANKALCARLRSGKLSTQDFYRQVLRVIYRMLFLFVAEDRDLLHSPLPGANASKEDIEQAHRTRRRYRDYYAITRLRGLTLHRAGTPHPDLWFIFQLLTQRLGSDTGCPELALPALGSFLWDAARSTPDLAGTLVFNRHFLTAVHALAFVQDGSVRRPIDYKNLGSEELGSVYEGLLELHPLINADSGVFELNIAAGNERLRAEDVDWSAGTVGFTRKKTGVPVIVHLGKDALEVLKDLPVEGALFPYLSAVRACDRATEFSQRCKQLGIHGVTLHSYRYAWAERAKVAGYPERFAQEALGHNSKAVHRAYAKRALMKLPSLQDYEERGNSAVPASSST